MEKLLTESQRKTIIEVLKQLEGIKRVLQEILKDEC